MTACRTCFAAFKANSSLKRSPDDAKTTGAANLYGLNANQVACWRKWRGENGASISKHAAVAHQAS